MAHFFYRVLLSFAGLINILLPSAAVAETTFGLAVLASHAETFPKDPVQEWNRTVPEIYYATLWETFGTHRELTKEILSGEKPATVEIYLSNEVCRWKNNCADFEFLPKYSVNAMQKALEQGDPSVIESYRAKAKEIKEFCDAHKKPQTKCLLTLGLEAVDSKKSLAAKVAAAKAAGWAQESLVFNPKSTSPFQRVGAAWYLELHGRKLAEFPTPPDRSIVTLDGDDVVFCNDNKPILRDPMTEEALHVWVAHYRTHARYVGFWCSGHQGITGGDSSKSGSPRSRAIQLPMADIQKFLRFAGLKASSGN